MSDKASLDLFAHRLSWRSELDAEDIAAVSNLPNNKRRVNANGYLIREGRPPPPACSLLIEGFAFRHKLNSEGARQIVSIHMPGDLLDLQHLFLKVADHSVQALTAIEVADIDRRALQKIILERPAVGRALWVDGLVDASIHREWVLNVGRRNARARIAHILCEIAVRMRAAGMIDDARFRLPLTQEQLGDAAGLTSVHVNRTLKSLARDSLIEHDGRWIAIRDWGRICHVGDFNPLYLHLDQVAPQFDGPLQLIFDNPLPSRRAIPGRTASLHPKSHAT